MQFASARRGFDGTWVRVPRSRPRPAIDVCAASRRRARRGISRVGDRRSVGCYRNNYREGPILSAGLEGSGSLKAYYFVVNTALRRRAALAVTLLCAACGSAGPTAPTAPALISQLSTTASSPAPSRFPPLEGRSRTFSFDRELSYRVSSYTQASRFVLYDNGAFVLRFDTVGVAYRGGYTEANGIIAFE